MIPPSVRGPANSLGCFQEAGSICPYFLKISALWHTCWCGGNPCNSLIALKDTPRSVLCIKDTKTNCLHQSRLLQKQEELDYLFPEASMSCPATELPWSKGAKGRKDPLEIGRGLGRQTILRISSKYLSTFPATSDYSLQLGPYLFGITWQTVLNTGIRSGIREQGLFCACLSQVEMVKMDVAYLQDFDLWVIDPWILHVTSLLMPFHERNVCLGSWPWTGCYKEGPIGSLRLIIKALRLDSEPFSPLLFYKSCR